ncbi:hypothetical protein MMC30_006466 [Trapelia coarctata]|nr:hypothetical protein [Trapelia coarctata]
MVESFPSFAPSSSVIHGSINISTSPPPLATGVLLTTTNAAGITAISTFEGGVVVVQASNQTMGQITHAASITGRSIIPTLLTSSNTVSPLLTSTLSTATSTPTSYPPLDTGAGVGVGVAIAATWLSFWGLGVYIWRRIREKKRGRLMQANDRGTPPEESNPHTQPELEDNGEYLYELSGGSRKAEIATGAERHELPVLERTQELYVEHRGHDPQAANNV